MIADKIRNSCINTQILTILKIIIGVNVSTFFKSIDSTLTDFHKPVIDPGVGQAEQVGVEGRLYRRAARV